MKHGARRDFAVKVFLVIPSGDILLVQNNSNGFWELPGGKSRKKDKSPLETAVRKVWRECGVAVDEKDLVFFKKIRHPAHDYYVYRCDQVWDIVWDDFSGKVRLFASAEELLDWGEELVFPPHFRLIEKSLREIALKQRKW